jgi:hypothetical protein
MSENSAVERETRETDPYMRLRQFMRKSDTSLLLLMLQLSVPLLLLRAIVSRDLRDEEMSAGASDEVVTMITTTSLVTRNLQETQRTTMITIVSLATKNQSESANEILSKKRPIELTGKSSWHAKSLLKSFVREVLLLVALLLTNTRRRRKKSYELSLHLEWRITRRKVSTMHQMPISN